MVRAETPVIVLQAKPVPQNLSGGGLSLFSVAKPLCETENEPQAVQALFDGRGIEKREHSSQMNFSAPESWKVTDRGLL